MNGEGAPMQPRVNGGKENDKDVKRKRKNVFLFSAIDLK